ncbi:MAG: hypothetical protein AAGI34_05650 [Pseudomonadota bacterium]
MIAMLEWIGARARWVLALGVVLATLLPTLSAALRPWLPGLVALLICLAMSRLDLAMLAQRALAPRRLGLLLLWTGALLVLSPILYYALARGAGLPEAHVAALVYTAAAPPITSATGLCLIMGLDAVLALELTVIASLATPLIGPVVIQTLLGTAVPLDATAMMLRVGAMIGAGALAALVLRRLLGPARIAAHTRAFDGVAALAMLLFIVPLFDGFWGLVTAEPALAATMLGLSVVANFGVQALTAALLRTRLAPETAGAAGLIWGNRTVALYLAALPFDPDFTLYVALYQVPMLFTPLMMGGLLHGRRPPKT